MELKIKILKEDSLGFNHPHLISEWCSVKNRELTPFDIKPNYREDVWWKCLKEDDHEWQATPRNRVGSDKKKGTGCPFCAGKLPSKNYNFEVKYPDLALDWHPENEKAPTEYVPGSTEIVKWKCHICNHEWDDKIVNRKVKPCSYCRSIAFKLPELAKLWHPTMNGKITPADIKAGTHDRHWWLCPNKSCGHYWDEVPKNLNRYLNKPCPKCKNKFAHEDYSLGLLYPNLVKEWHHINDKTPYDYLPKSNDLVWWKCSICENEWDAVISSRTSGRGCPECQDWRNTSFPEQALFFYLRKITNTKNRVKEEQIFKGKEIDLFLPDIPLAIEYDGEFHNKRIKQDEEKNRLLQGKVQLIRIRDQQLPDIKWYGAIVIKHEYPNLESLKECILKIFSYIKGKRPQYSKIINSIKIDLDKDFFEILAQVRYSRRENSIAAKYPEVARDWDYEKNSPLTPDKITYGSPKKVHWKCHRCGHPWKKSVVKRTTGNLGCEQCRLNGIHRIYPEHESGISVEKRIIQLWEYGMNANKIAEELRNEGYKTLKGASFSRTAVTRELERIEKEHQIKQGTQYAIDLARKREKERLLKYPAHPSGIFVVDRMMQLRESDLSFKMIADKLNDEGYRTINGFTFERSTVHKEIKRRIKFGIEVK